MTECISICFQAHISNRIPSLIFNTINFSESGIFRIVHSIIPYHTQNSRWPFPRKRWYLIYFPGWDIFLQPTLSAQIVLIQVRHCIAFYHFSTVSTTWWELSCKWSNNLSWAWLHLLEFSFILSKYVVPISWERGKSHFLTLKYYQEIFGKY